MPENHEYKFTSTNGTPEEFDGAVMGTRTYGPDSNEITMG